MVALRLSKSALTAMVLSLLFVVLVPAAVAIACEGGGGGEEKGSGITVSPKPVKFSGGKTTKKITVQNWTAEALSLDVTASSGFKLLGGCSHVLTSKCEETVECEKTFNTGWFKAFTEPPDEFYSDETNLQC